LPESQVGRDDKLSFALAISPIALAFLLGWAAKASGILKAEHWAGIETLSFRLLIPAILIHAIASADLDPAKIGPLAIALLITVAIAGLGALALRLIWQQERVSNAALSTLFQTSTRWNAFIALSAAELWGGRKFFC
jgi:malonate transporter